MSKEQEVFDVLRAKLGDDGFKFVARAGGALATAINDDLVACWPKWVDIATTEKNSQGHGVSVRMVLAAVLIGQAVASLTDEARAEGREKFERTCGMLFDIQVEAMTAEPRH